MTKLVTVHTHRPLVYDVYLTCDAMGWIKYCTIQWLMWLMPALLHNYRENLSSRKVKIFKILHTTSGWVLQKASVARRIAVLGTKSVTIWASLKGH
jgi:hypothetical protein